MKGKPIVLTASAAEISQFDANPEGIPDEFMAFVCTFPYKIMRPFLKNNFMPIRNEDGSSKFANANREAVKDQGMIRMLACIGGSGTVINLLLAQGELPDG